MPDVMVKHTESGQVVRITEPTSMRVDAFIVTRPELAVPTWRARLYWAWEVLTGQPLPCELAVHIGEHEQVPGALHYQAVAWVGGESGVPGGVYYRAEPPRYLAVNPDEFVICKVCGQVANDTCYTLQHPMFVGREDGAVRNPHSGVWERQEMVRGRWTGGWVPA